MQVLTPNGLEKLETGQTVPIQWQSDGLTSIQPVALIDSGGNGTAPWSPESYRIAGSNTTITLPVSLVGVANPAPAAVYQTVSDGGSGIFNRLAYQIPLADGDYSLRLHFVDPTSTSAGQRLFDIRINGVLVRS